VRAGAGRDLVRGGRGADFVAGGPGKDRLIGGPGSDKLSARDGVADRVSCGRGKHDRAVLDARDRIADASAAHPRGSCEIVVRSSEPAGQGPTGTKVGSPSAGASPTPQPPVPPPSFPTATTEPTVLAAGDIAGCDTSGDEATAAILDANPGGVVAPLGDLAYEYGTAAGFANCYAPTWGRHKARSRPAVGGHEYLTAGAVPYYDYFGALAGDRTKGYYSYDLGSWHVISLNPVCDEIGGCGAGSPEERWLQADLAAHPAQCTIAYWHDPRFSSGRVHGSNPTYTAFWQALYDHGADLVLSAHDHIYERFAPQTPAGALDVVHGIREFVVGTGGRSHYRFGKIEPNSELRNNTTFGVLKLDLRPSSYQWRFIPEAGKTFTDAGTTFCH
jgi:hypothetical protein